MSRSQNKRHLHTRTMLSKALKVQSFASTHFTSILGSFTKKSKSANSNYIEKRDVPHKEKALGFGRQERS